MEALLDHGEGLLVPERMIVAPTVGTFRPVDVPDGSTLEAGQTIGLLEGPGTSTPVSSPFAGRNHASTSPPRMMMESFSSPRTPTSAWGLGRRK